MTQIDFAKYSHYSENENFKSVKNKYKNLDFYITEEEVVRFFAVVEYYCRSLGFQMFEVVYFPGTYTAAVFDDLSELQLISTFLWQHGELSAKLMDRTNSKNPILSSRLVEVMYGK